MFVPIHILNVERSTCTEIIFVQKYILGLMVSLVKERHPETQKVKAIIMNNKTYVRI